MKRNKILKYSVFGVMAILLIVQILFSIPAPTKCLEAVWSAGDLITFIGTMFLGVVAILQTEQANDMSERANNMAERLMEIEEDRFKLDIRPFFIVTDYKVYELFDDEIKSADKLYIEIDKHENYEKLLGLELHLFNTTNSFITARFFSGSSSESNKKIHLKNSVKNQDNTKLCIRPNEDAEIVFYSGKSFFEKLKIGSITMRFILENRIAEQYIETFDLTINYLLEMDNIKSGWYCECDIQNYNIDRLGKHDSSETAELQE